MKRWVIGVTQLAEEQITAISDQRIQKAIRQRIDQLEYDPDKQGKPMRNELIGFRSVRAVGQRYRILYQLKEQQVFVIVVAVGIRKEGDKKDIYELATRMARLGLLNFEKDSS